MDLITPVVYENPGKGYPVDALTGDMRARLPDIDSR
jgi:hypothetical protein